MLRGTRNIAAALLTAVVAALGIPGCILDFEGLADSSSTGTSTGTGTGTGTGTDTSTDTSTDTGPSCTLCALCKDSCEGTDCHALADTMGTPTAFRVAVDSGALYAADFQGQAIVRVAPEQGPEKLQVPAEPAVIAANDTHLVWAREGGGIYRCALPGCTDAVQLAQPGTDTVVRQFAFDEGWLYWLVGPDKSNSNLMRCSLSGCAPEAIAQGLDRPHGLVIGGEYVYWTNHGSGGSADGTISRARKDGSEVITYLGGILAPSGVTLTATHLYYTVAASQGAVYRCALGATACGTPEQVSPIVSSVDHPVRSPRSVVVAGDHVYWTNDGDTTVMACPAAGCSTTADGLAEIIADGQVAPGGIVAADGCVFWAAQAGAFGAAQL